MSENRYCPYCGGLINPEDVFCNNCGASLEENNAGKTPSQLLRGSNQPIDDYQSRSQNDYSTFNGHSTSNQQEQEYHSQQSYGTNYQEQYTYGTQTYTPPPQIEKNNAAVASFICAVTAIFISFIPIIGWISPVLIIAGFVLGIIGVRKQKYKGFAIAGLIISIIAIGIFILAIIAVLVAIGLG
jgi:hypothetical protein